jgi:hypothetical protein
LKKQIFWVHKKILIIYWKSPSKFVPDLVNEECRHGLINAVQTCLGASEIKRSYESDSLSQKVFNYGM